MYQFIRFVFFLLVIVDFCSGDLSPAIYKDTRIIGGYDADIRQFPYQVSLQYFNQHFCGGSLITPSFVLSAAHCFPSGSNSNPVWYSVRVGSNSTRGTDGTTVNICSVKVHEKYNSSTIDYDISIIKLCSNLTLGKTVQTIVLAERKLYAAGNLALVSGWGYEAENGTISSNLKAALVPMTTKQYCLEAYKSMVQITSNMICAGFQQGGKDACQGDSGGPLAYNNDLIGIVSFGAGCARQGYPGVYTNVANLIQWITNNSDYKANSSTRWGDSGGPLVYKKTLIGIVSFGEGCAQKGFPGVYTNVANLINWIKRNANSQLHRNYAPETGEQIYLIASLLILFYFTF